MPLKYVFLQLRFRRIFASILFFVLGVVIGHISLIGGLVTCLVFLLALLIYVLDTHLSYKRNGAD